MASALLVMDMQEAIVGRIADPTALIERIFTAIAAARRADVPVIYVRIAFRPGIPKRARTTRASPRSRTRATDSSTVFPRPRFTPPLHHCPVIRSC
jgi:nicotinamidase-related amidase